MQCWRNIIWLFCLLLLAKPQDAVAVLSTDSLMIRLDEVIAKRPEYERAKIERIMELRNSYFSNDDEREKFEILDRLFQEYLPFNSDSAYMMSRRQEVLGKKLGDRELVARGRMNRANILSAIGMYKETIDLVDTIGRGYIPDYLYSYYYHTKRTVYDRLADYAAFDPERRQYKNLTELYRDSILMVNDRESLTYVLVKADQLNVNGKARQAIDMLGGQMDNEKLNEHEKAICAWTLARSYELCGDTAMQKKYIIMSAISDMKSSVREYVSLRQLALMLYREGDLDRAHRFMTIAVDDAVKCNARQRIVELNDNYPQINAIYVETVRQQQRKLVRTVVIITVLAVALLVLILLMRKQMRRVAKARMELEKANRQLSELNQEMQMSNTRLAEAYNEISEISELKETYISRYMDQCLLYIEKLDAYRKSVSKLMSSGKTDDLRKLVKSSAMIDDELKDFYARFDETFLSLFPAFVEDFNALLQDGEEIIPKRPGSLNAELRIYALIRLGITDSDKIARFLRYSLTTIYNYRTRVRNKAKGDRNSLEVEIMNISRRKIVG